MQQKLETLQAKLKEVKHLRDIEALLGWDQQVFMPPVEPQHGRNKWLP